MTPASGKSESVSACSPFLLAISLFYKTTGILCPYERCENTLCAAAEPGHLKNSLSKPFYPPHFPKQPCQQSQTDTHVDMTASKEIWVKITSAKQEKLAHIT